MEFSDSGNQRRFFSTLTTKNPDFWDLLSTKPPTLMENGPANHFETLIGVYNERIQTQLSSVICELTYLSENVANLILVHHPEAFHDFMRRKNTGAISVDPTNFHACLAGSIVMYGSAQAHNASARQVEEELVSSSEILERLNSA